ncbi:MAG: aceE, partial [Gammaproteobacteria bacterium]|jgi:pyruvate dehydrogenase E1 component|nr:aceE [Gammaproteobacteria bacterium]
VTQCLKNQKGPVIAATDYMKLYADQIRPYVPQPYYVLGTDGFGWSDTRTHLREYFEVNAAHIAYTALYALVNEGSLEQAVLTKAAKNL